MPLPLDIGAVRVLCRRRLVPEAGRVAGAFGSGDRAGRAKPGARFPGPRRATWAVVAIGECKRHSRKRRNREWFNREWLNQEGPRHRCRVLTRLSNASLVLGGLFGSHTRAIARSASAARAAGASTHSRPNPGSNGSMAVTLRVSCERACFIRRSGPGTRRDLKVRIPERSLSRVWTRFNFFVMGSATEFGVSGSHALGESTCHRNTLTGGTPWSHRANRGVAVQHVGDPPGCEGSCLRLRSVDSIPVRRVWAAFERVPSDYHDKPREVQGSTGSLAEPGDHVVHYPNQPPDKRAGHGSVKETDDAAWPGH